MIQITSDQNPKFKRALRLHESRGRKQQERIIIFGENEIRRAMSSGIEFLETFVCPQLCPGQSNIASNETFELSERLFNKLAFGQRNYGIVAVAKRPETVFDASSLNSASLVLVLESIEKPGNIGAVFRSASGAGVDAIVLSNPVCDVFHPNAIRASLGAVFSIPVFVANNEKVAEVLKKNDFQRIATRVNGGMSYTECDLSPKSAILLGNESKGLSSFWNGSDITRVTIPMADSIDSLNIAMTSTLMVFEARRQRSAKNI